MSTVRAQVLVELEGSKNALFTTFNQLSDGKEHIALVFGKPDNVPLVRVHSECLTGDVFGSRRCDCGSQLEEATARLAREGGVLLYMRQEGRGIGLYNKIDAYKVQDTLGLDTFAANRHLGFPDDARDYTAAAEMLKALGFERIRLLGSPDKAAQLSAHGIDVAERIDAPGQVHDGNRRYLAAKAARKGGMPCP